MLQNVCGRLTLLAFALIAIAPIRAHADSWSAPIPEELTMKSVPQAPGAPAVYLFREENTDDRQRVYSEYVRIKVLTEAGRDQANIELKYFTGFEHNWAIAEVAGRTIHPDGSIVLFTGKPHDRSIIKSVDARRGVEYKAKVFTLPDVTVGSVLEYRYKILMPANYFQAPQWIVQNSLFLMHGHFIWRTTDKPLYTVDERGSVIESASFTPVLPPGVQVKQLNAGGDGASLLNLDVHDIAPLLEEDFMPPASSLGYRVMFYYARYTKVDEFWKGEGKHWSKEKDKFIGPGPIVKATVEQLTSANDSQGQKVKKLYEAVEQLENTDYTRQHSSDEDKAEGLRTVHTADDIWTQKRGTGNQITLLFLAMTRAAKFKSYLVAVTDRSKWTFNKNFLDLGQFDDDIAIVVVDGKELPFDPGARYSPYGHLSWIHTETGALRQTDGGTELVVTPGEAYSFSGVSRVANLNMDATGQVAGIVTEKLVGYPALKWRHEFLRSDLDSVQRGLTESMEQMLPAGMEVKFVSIGRLEDYEEPLAVSFAISGIVGVATGTRLLIPGDLFETNSRSEFVSDKRNQAVWLSYRYGARDAIRISMPANLHAEAVPQDGVVKTANVGGYSLKATCDGSSVTIRRDLFVTNVFFAPDRYMDLHSFYAQFGAKDQEPLVLRISPASSPGN